MTAPSLAQPDVLSRLPERYSPHWNILEYCRHIGIKKNRGKPAFWMARVRKTNGNYKEVRLGHADPEHPKHIAYGPALELAREWFASPEIAAISSRAYRPGPGRSVSCAVFDDLTITRAK